MEVATLAAGQMPDTTKTQQETPQVTNTKTSQSINTKTSDMMKKRYNGLNQRGTGSLSFGSIA
jgi:hypothetical protein